MENEGAWQSEGSGSIVQYDFIPPPSWTSARIAAQQMGIADTLEARDLQAPWPGWCDLLRRLPAALKASLVAELRAGNQIIGIGSTGWPNQGSIVVNLRERFYTVAHTRPAGVVWRELNDPHYAREELSERVGSAEFLILT